MKQDIIEMLNEIQSICIGADSPDAIENGKNNPADELENADKICPPLVIM